MLHVGVKVVAPRLAPHAPISPHKYRAAQVALVYGVTTREVLARLYMGKGERGQRQKEHFVVFDDSELLIRI